MSVKGKLGRISKTIKVHTNDPKSPIAILTVTMTVRDTLHMKKFPSTEIFKGQCRSCHVDRGKGKTGGALFVSDCIMCHSVGKSAPQLLVMRKKPREYISKAIREGVGNSSMPGWDMNHGGPLSDEEIESLIKVIKP